MSSDAAASAVVAALDACLGEHQKPVALHEPEIGERERELVDDCLGSGWLSTGSRYVESFEDGLTGATGSAHAVACVNGTAALALALRIAGVSEGDEVLVPSLSFVATSNSVRHIGAIPHFVDISPKDLGVDAAALHDHLESATQIRDGRRVNNKTGNRIAALVPVHVFGHPAAMTELLGVAAETGIPVVEDAAEALGSLYRDKHCGTFGALGVLSFNGNKIVTTGGGGAILTQDESLADHARHLSTTAKVPHPWEYRHDEVGYNYRLPGINAAIGCAQLERLDELVARKRRLAAKYREALSGISELIVLSEPADARSNYWLNAIVAPDAETQGAILEQTNRAGYRTRPAWVPSHQLPMYAECPRAPLPVTEELAPRIVNLPSSAKLA
jgi:perosamine synthetase